MPYELPAPLPLTPKQPCIKHPRHGREAHTKRLLLFRHVRRLVCHAPASSQPFTLFINSGAAVRMGTGELRLPSAPLLIVVSRSPLGTSVHPPRQVRNCPRTRPARAPLVAGHSRDHHLTRHPWTLERKVTPKPAGGGRRRPRPTAHGPRPSALICHPTGPTGSDAQLAHRDSTQGRTRTSLAPISRLSCPHDLHACTWLTRPCCPAATLRVHCPPRTTLLRASHPFLLRRLSLPHNSHFRTLLNHSSLPFHCANPHFRHPPPAPPAPLDPLLRPPSAPLRSAAVIAVALPWTTTNTILLSLPAGRPDTGAPSD